MIGVCNTDTNKMIKSLDEQFDKIVVVKNGEKSEYYIDGKKIFNDNNDGNKFIWCNPILFEGISSDVDEIKSIVYYYFSFKFPSIGIHNYSIYVYPI